MEEKQKKEIFKNTIKYGATFLNSNEEIIPNDKIFLKNNEAIILDTDEQMHENEIKNKIEFDMQKILEQDTPTIEEIAKKIEKEEHRHLIKEKDGTFREESDEEFKNRLMQKYLDTDEQMHEYSEWQADYAEMQAEWYADNM